MIKFRKISRALSLDARFRVVVYSYHLTWWSTKIWYDRCASYRAQAHPPSHPPAPHPQEVSRNYGWISISPPSGSSDHGAESLMTNTYFLTLERGFSITETTLIITRFPPWINRFSSLHGLCWEFRGFLIFSCWSTKFQQFQECLRLNTFDQMRRLSEAFSFELSRRLWPPA